MADNKGWVKLHRRFLDWGWYSDINTKTVFLHLLLTANWVESEYLGYKILPGQTIIGTLQLAKDLGLTRQQVRTSLKKLERTGEITRKSTNQFTIITVENWSLYQDNRQDDNQQVTSRKTGFHINDTEKQPAKNVDFTETTQSSNQQITSQNHWNNSDTAFSLFEDNQRITNEQPTDNQRITNEQPTSNHTIRIEEDKKDKKDKNNKNTPKESAREFAKKMPDELQPVLEEFILFRERAKKPLTGYALKLALNKAKKFANDDIDMTIAIINQSIANGWTGIYPIKDKEPKENVSFMDL